MSTVTNTVNTNNQATFQVDRSFLFLGENTFEVQAFSVNGSEITLAEGQVMGRISATGAVIELKSAAVDGSEIPYGILTEGIVIPIGDTPALSICVEGKVALEKIVFDGADTVATVVDSRRLDDRIAADTVGIKLIDSVELTKADN